MLFADHGLNTAEISSLLFFWSVTAFVLEVPSGAWADTVSRRGLLISAAVLTAIGFTVWTVFPSYLGFAAGFVLWGIGGSLQSGTFQALLYDELAARSTAREYPKLIGYATSASEAGALLGILSAAPLFAWGGYVLVGWVSVAVVSLQAVLAASLPSAPKAASVGPSRSGSALGTYVSMLKSGTSEALVNPTVRGGVLLSSMLFGFTAFDEYFGLLASANGAATGTVPLLVGLTVAGSLIGSVVAGRTAKMRSSMMAWALVLAGATMAAGALVGGSGLLGIAGFALIGVAYGIVMNSVIVSEARLQDAIEGPARATVTSASGLFSEVVGLAVFGAVALMSAWLPMSVIIALLGVPVALTAAIVPRWLPKLRADPVEPVEVNR